MARNEKDTTLVKVEMTADQSVYSFQICAYEVGEGYSGEICVSCGGS